MSKVAKEKVVKEKVAKENITKENENSIIDRLDEIIKIMKTENSSNIHYIPTACLESTVNKDNFDKKEIKKYIMKYINKNLITLIRDYLADKGLDLDDIINMNSINEDPTPISSIEDIIISYFNNLGYKIIESKYDGTGISPTGILNPHYTKKMLDIALSNKSLVNGLLDGESVIIYNDLIKITNFNTNDYNMISYRSYFEEIYRILIELIDKNPDAFCDYFEYDENQD
jgi:hypothetical protein